MEKESRLLTEEAGGDGKTSQSTDSRSSLGLRFRTFPVFTAFSRILSRQQHSIVLATCGKGCGQMDLTGLDGLLWWSFRHLLCRLWL